MHSMLSLVCPWPLPIFQAPLAILQPTLRAFWQLPPRRQLHRRSSCRPQRWDDRPVRSSSTAGLNSGLLYRSGALLQCHAI